MLERKRERERRIFALCKNKETISRVDGTLGLLVFYVFAVLRDLFDLCRCAYLDYYHVYWCLRLNEREEIDKYPRSRE